MVARSFLSLGGPRRGELVSSGSGRLGAGCRLRGGVPAGRVWAPFFSSVQGRSGGGKRSGFRKGCQTSGGEGVGGGCQGSLMPTTTRPACLHQQGAALQPAAVETRPSPRESWWAQLRRQPRLWLLHSPRPRIGAKAPPSLWEPPAGCSGSPSSACMTGPLARPGQGWFPVVRQQFPWSLKQGLRSRTRDHPLRDTDAGGHAAIATPRAAPLWGSVGGPRTAPLPV